MLNKMGTHTDVMTFNMNRKWNPSWRGTIERIDGVQVFKIPGLNWLPTEHSSRVNMGVNLIPGKFTNLLENYDIIHFHEEFSFPFFSYLVEKPKIFQFHGWIAANPRQKNFILNFILKRIADRYICLTKIMAENLAKMGVDEKKIRVLPNGVDTEFFHPSRAKESNMVLFVGRISLEKGVHVLLKSLSYLKMPIHLVIIGPPSYNAKYFQMMLGLIRNENKKGYHRIMYLGEQEQTDLVQWYQEASIFVLPSFWEGFPVANLEALACETPVVATNIGGNPEVISHYENGMLVPPNDPVKLAESIQYLLDNETIATKLGKQGRKFVVENFSLKTVTKKLLGIYKEIFDP